MLISVFVGMSLDGFIARKDDSYDFLRSAEGGGSGPMGFADLWKSIDALLIGRKTYEIVLAMDKWFYGKKPVFVLSKNKLAPAPKGAIVEHMKGTPHEVVAQLEGRKYRHIYLDGGLTVQSFLADGLVDRIIMTRVPVIIGEGIPLFGPVPRDISVELVGIRCSGSAVQSEYHVKDRRTKTIEPLWRDGRAPKKKPKRKTKK